MTINRKDMKEFLYDGICEVLFEKKDGTERKMICTLNSEEIPADMTLALQMTKRLFLSTLPKNIGNPPDEENKDYINVFDVEKQGWRSFIVEKVKYIKPTL
jgi:hypothetical protein